MIVVVVTTEVDKQGRKRLIASHGIDTETGRNVILPCDPPADLGAVFDEQMGEFVIR